MPLDSINVWTIVLWKWPFNQLGTNLSQKLYHLNHFFFLDENSKQFTETRYKLKRYTLAAIFYSNQDMQNKEKSIYNIRKYIQNILILLKSLILKKNDDIKKVGI